MKTSAYDKQSKFTCDCCNERPTRKGGYFPFYLCANDARLPLEDVLKRRAAKYGSSDKWISETLNYERVMAEQYGQPEYDQHGNYTRRFAGKIGLTVRGAS